MNKYSIGCEFGSTRIKSVLINENFEVEATGIFDWENVLDNGLWSYKEETILEGLKSCFEDLKHNYETTKGKDFPIVGSLGFSAMMHGYIVLDKNDKLLVPFRTWRNTNTGESAAKLSSLFNFNIPMRWSIAHLYQAILNKEPHLKDIAYLTTLEGYIHYKLTGEKVIGVGEASGMFPIDTNSNFDPELIKKFDDLIASENLPWKVEDILPKIKNAGEIAGRLTEKGKQLLGDLPIEVGTPLCPPEGDAETGMMATNSIKPGTGNVSAGTSVFAMIVLKDKLKHAYPEIDVVATPHGKPVAMVHSNNCTSDINYWAGLFGDVLKEFGVNPSTGDLYTKLFNSALKGDEDCGNLTNFNFFSGEPVLKVDNGRPLFIREQESVMSLPNFMRTQLFSSLAAIAVGMKILEKEGITIDEIFGHGGFFKTKEPAGRYMSCALNAPVSLMETASEGGAWGIALLANYINYSDLSLEEFTEKVFKDAKCTKISAKEEDKKSFKIYLERYMKLLNIEQNF